MTGDRPTPRTRPASRRSLRPAAAALVALLTGGADLPAAQAAGDGEQRPAWRPSAFFVQVGVAEGASTAIAGALWDWSWRRDFALGSVTGYWELSLGRWKSQSGDDAHAWVTQLGLTPVFRLHPAGWGEGWFVEGGVGANVLAPIYRTEDKRFSTVFNLGSHLALGRRFGQAGDRELALRVQHFSNAGIRHPNPGEDFVQLRYAMDF